MPTHPVTIRPDLGLPQLLHQLWHHLGRRRQLQLTWALLLMLASSMAEVVSLAAVLPFLGVLSDPNTLWIQPQVQEWIPRLGITGPQSLLITATSAFALSVLVAGVIRLLNLWFNGLLAAAIGSDISCEVYRRTLYQPYVTHLSRNSSQLIAAIVNDVATVVGSIISPLLQLVGSVITAFGLILALLAVNWLIVFVAGIVVVILYAIVMAGSLRTLQRLGERQVVLGRLLIQALQEGIGAIRDVLLDGSQQIYLKTYRKSDLPLRRAGALASFLTSYPRLALETVGLFLFSIAGYLSIINGYSSSVLPTLGFFALGAQRLLPMAQKIYEGYAQSSNSKKSLVNVLQLLNQPLTSDAHAFQVQPLQFKDQICFDSVRFRYGDNLPWVLDSINIEIRRGERTGLVGTTGSGKSTMVDLLLGLLTPTEGRLLVDGVDLQKSQHCAAWRGAIAHVPQVIFLTDSSIAENIAFGLEKGDIDMIRVIQAARQAQIAEFIESTPDGYFTLVGERGVCLSGGQRQRIGIARALYKRAQVLVFDEATSALDAVTEAAVMESIYGLNQELTVIIVAHRINTINNCDRVIRLNRGQVENKRA